MHMHAYKNKSFVCLGLSGISCLCLCYFYMLKRVALFSVWLAENQWLWTSHQSACWLQSWYLQFTLWSLLNAVFTQKPNYICHKLFIFSALLRSPLFSKTVRTSTSLITSWINKQHKQGWYWDDNLLCELGPLFSIWSSVLKPFFHSIFSASVW